MERRTRVIAVLVTWNRRDQLEESLLALGAQEPPPDHVVVVDNASDDGTPGMLALRFPEVEVVRTSRNIGGAGGFALGIHRAAAQASDALWLMDDDTVPQPGALKALVTARDGYASSASGTDAPAVVASRVVWTDGRDHPMNTPRPKPGASSAEIDSARAVCCLPIRTASFVSILVDTGRVREVGLPIAGFFLWNDDFEYTARLLRGRRGLSCPSSVVVHKTAKFGGIDKDPGERFHLEVRNKTWMYARTGSLSPTEKVLYGGATALRWARVIARSEHRPVLFRALRTGLRDGLRSGPRRTEDIIAEALVPAEQEQP